MPLAPLALLVALAWSPIAEAQPRPRPLPPGSEWSPPPGRPGPGFGGPRGPRPFPRRFPPPCPIDEGSNGLVTDLESLPGVGTSEPEPTPAPPPTETTAQPAMPEPGTSTPEFRTTTAPATGTAAVPYFYQYANRLNPGSSCQNTSLAMLLGHYGVKVSPDQITARFGKDLAQSPAGLAQVFNTYAEEAGIPERLRAHTDGSMADVNRQLQAGTPTIVHGYFTSSGHVVLATGYNGSSYTVNDPAGRWNGSFMGGYSGAQGSSSGKGVTYSAGSFRSAIATSNGSAPLSVWWHEVVMAP